MEQVIEGHSAVREVAVVGVAHPVLGEDVVAFVALSPGHEATGEDLRAYTLEHLAAYKVPRRWEFVDQLPRNATGKVVKLQLRDRLPGAGPPGADPAVSTAPDRTGAAAPDPVHGLTLLDVLAEHRRSRPHTRSVVCGEVRLTYPELDERTDRLAGALAAAGVGRGDRVVWLGQNCHRLIETWLAGAKVGAVLVPANWRQSASEMVTLLADARPVVVIWQNEEIGTVVEEARSQWTARPIGSTTTRPRPTTTVTRGS